MLTAQAAIERLCDPQSEVSAHYVICKTGAVTQLVREEDRAWHAGVGEWRGQQDINSRSIGIELDNRGDHPFPEPQMDSLIQLISQIKEKWAIPTDDIIGHSDMAPGRKVDPGARFDWARLARLGLAGPTTSQGEETDFATAAKAAGFTSAVDTDVLLASTRMRFAPWRTGPLCAQDLDLFHAL